MKNEDNKSNTVPSHDCRLTALDLGNFKAFADTQHLPIKPLTLIFGANSSGKSSLIHSLLLANHALANGNVDVHQPKLAGQSVDLGGFNEFVHRHELTRECALAFTFHHKPFGTATWFGEFSRTTLRFEIGRAIDTESGREHSGSIGVSSFSVEADDQDFLRAARTKDGSLRINRINLEHPYFTRFFAHINKLRPPESTFRQPLGPWQTNDSVARLMETANSPAAQINLEASVELKRAFEQIARAEEGLKRLHEEDVEIRADFFGQLRLEFDWRIGEIPLRPGNLAPVSVRSKGLREHYWKDAEFGDVWRGLEERENCDFFEDVAQIFCFEMEELLDWINTEFSRCLNSLTYLGPLRCNPPRHLVGMHDEDPNWFSGGGHAWDIIRHDRDVVRKVNSLLGSSQWQNANYELRVRYLKDLGRVDNAEKKRLAERLQQVGANNETSALTAVEALLADLSGDQMGTAFGETTLLDKRTGLEVSHRDVGVGISQILPVLVHAYADRNQIVAIEQPEIHLHPALQAELGDVFIESALGERKNTFILETHSEHLILRIMRRMRETYQKKLPDGMPPVFPKDVAIIFVERDGSRSIVREMPLDEIGRLVKAWPGGFFEDGFRELFS